MGRSNKLFQTLPPAPVVEYIAPHPAVHVALAPVDEYVAPAPAVCVAPAPVEYIAPAPAVCAAPSPSVEYITPAPAVYAAQAPVVEYLAPAPALSEAPAPVVEYFAPAPALSEAPAPVAEFIAPSAGTQFFSLSTASAPRVERASRHRQVLCRDAVLWTRPGTSLTCRWSGSCVLLWHAWGTSGDAQKRERNSWRGLCYISVMSCSRAQVMGIR